MELPSQTLTKAVKEFNKLSGMGSRTALRCVLEIIKWEDEEIDTFAEAIKSLKLKDALCEKCFNICESPICPICADTSRDASIVCVVEDIRSLIAIENTNEYRGVYHILGGLISPMDGIGPAALNIEPLLKRIEDDPIKEIFFALSATLEGDTTMFYLNKKISKYENIVISTISRGISLGNEIEYTDSVTLGKSINKRIPCADNNLTY